MTEREIRLLNDLRRALHDTMFHASVVMTLSRPKSVHHECALRDHNWAEHRFNQLREPQNAEVSS